MDTPAPVSGRPLVVGLTGGIASGKTAAANRFGELGAEVVDTDRLARDVVAPGSEGLRRVVDAFGEGVLTAEGALDRAAMRDRVFRDPQARARLEAITHPLIEQGVRERIAASRAPYVILVVPLLVEKGWQRLADRVLVVDTPEAEQRRRLAVRDGTPDDQADAMLASQADRAERLAAADDVIRNDADLAALHRQVDALDRHYRRLTGSDRSRPPT